MGGQAAKPAIRVSKNIAQLSSKRVFMDFQIGSSPPQRVYIYLYDKIVPKTSENFLALCTGELEYGYKVNYDLNRLINQGCQTAFFVKYRVGTRTATELRLRSEGDLTE